MPAIPELARRNDIILAAKHRYESFQHTGASSPKSAELDMADVLRIVVAHHNGVPMDRMDYRNTAWVVFHDCNELILQHHPRDVYAQVLLGLDNDYNPCYMATVENKAPYIKRLLHRAIGLLQTISTDDIEHLDITLDPLLQAKIYRWMMAIPEDGFKPTEDSS